MRPMLATRGNRVPAGPDWLHEVKWDGMRVLAEVVDDPERGWQVRVWSRNEKPATATFPELAELVQLGRALLLDGEVVALGDDGRPSFARLGERMHVVDVRRATRLAANVPITLMAFDLLALDGADLTGRPLAERRSLLEELATGRHWQVPPAYDDGPDLLEAARQQGLEGIVSKRRDSTYHPGRRSRSWLKFPLRRTGSYVVGGWRPEIGSADRLGAVLVGEPTPSGLAYRGRVGSGLAGAAAQRLISTLVPLTTDESPFAEAVPRVDATGARWVSPMLVVDVEFLELTSEGRLRQPAYRGIRSDLEPADVAEDVTQR